MKNAIYPASRGRADRELHGRRGFLRKSGMGLAAAGLFLTACNDDEDPIMGPGMVFLGSGDVGVLNYAYALEQLEAAFYARVIGDASFASTFSAEEQQVLSDLAAHERAHADFFAAAIGSVATAIPALEVDFSSVDFSNRTSVLNTAQTFEDLGVGAYNGAGRLLTNPDFLLVAGKIVSVEARHAAAIRSLNSDSPTAFADLADSNGLDVALTPDQVLAAASSFIVTSIDASGLPQ